MRIASLLVLLGGALPRATAGAAEAPPAGSWTDAAREYLDASRAYFSAPGGNDARGVAGVAQAYRMLARNLPSAAELRAPLAGEDEAATGLAIAALSLVDSPDPELVRLVLQRTPQQPDRIVRQLVPGVLQRAGKEWMQRNGALVVRAFAHETDPNITISVAAGVLCILEEDDSVSLAVALAVHGEEVTRNASFLLLSECKGTATLRRVAERLRREGEADLAEDADAAAVRLGWAPLGPG